MFEKKKKKIFELYKILANKDKVKYSWKISEKPFRQTAKQRQNWERGGEGKRARDANRDRTDITGERRGRERPVVLHTYIEISTTSTP